MDGPGATVHKCMSYEACTEELSVIACAVSMAFPPTHNTKEMANYVRETFIWHRRSPLRLPRPLPEDFNVLCPCFSLAEAEAAAAESELPEIIQAMFYTMLLTKMLKLGVVQKYTAERIKSLLVGLMWPTFEVWMRIMDEVIRGAQFHRQPDEVDVKGARDGQGRVHDQPILLPLLATRSRPSFYFVLFVLSCFPFSRLY
ncbi:hypothetical protein Cgig2_024776 [Carnegiea gigantea]|uniref:Uncharacterized protein n=1 Tax=Carnegiea gigantea TaxID=171969 RepID=A0A9Q1JJL1_9CARY|nr:hypothetical protein Cgig2_024776 [Carnegiea gigantea]